MTHELDKILILPSQPDFKEKIDKLREKKAPAGRFKGYDSEGSQTVLQIIRDVAKNGDKAVRKYTKTYDREDLTASEFKISPADLKKAHAEIEPKLLASIRQAIENVRKYQSEIFIGKDQTCSGGTAIKYTPIKRVGICVPGAAAPMPSTVIMTAVPAMVAGIKPQNIVVVSPPRYKPNPQAKGTIHPITLAVCYELQIENVYRIGGAQAVAALASDKGTIPQVDKIVGPGSPWVQTAKKMVSQDYVAIDSIAGPSEVLIIANKEANPAWVAADMLSQAEHAPGSAVLFTDLQALAENVLTELKKQVKQLGRAKETIECLKGYSGIAVFENMDDVIEWANAFVTEHLEIQCGEKSREIADRIKNAGAIFIGDYSPTAVGDYWAGPSHTLPTGGGARFSSALSANDFIKSTSIIEYDKKKLTESADDIIRLAEAEGLDAHAKSIKIRRQE